jgi:glucoamylase
VRFQSLDGRSYRVDVTARPELSNGTTQQTGACSGHSLVAGDGQMASAILASPALQDPSCDSTGPGGALVQRARTALSGSSGHDRLTLALAFGPAPVEAMSTARSSLRDGFQPIARGYASGWHDYLARLKQPPQSLSSSEEQLAYSVSQMALAASEDKTYRGAYVASPTMPWAWGLLTIDDPSDAYHLVWPRDLYQIATAMLADGDRAGANRALDFAFDHQQKADGSFPQNTGVDGTPRWTNLQLDEVALPLVLAWQLRRFDAATYSHVKRAADFIAANGPVTPQERWENQSGYSPATIAAEIAGLVTAADIARRGGDTASAIRWDAVADDWQSKVDGWTVTTNGPYSSKPYYLRLTKDGNPNAGTTYSIGDGGPAAEDQRRVVDPSFLELVRLGVKRFDHPPILSTLPVVDHQLGVDTPNGRFWHRYTFDGYGETRTGGPWDVSDPGTFRTIGRAWPIFAGERGEYELLAGRSARPELAAMAAAANDGWMMPEQVWDGAPPSGRPVGEGTFSATPLVWSHAQFVRLAWSIQAGAPVERPAIVACRYAGEQGPPSPSCSSR